MNEVELLKKQIQEEVKEKYSLYKRIKELNEEIEELKKQNQDDNSPGRINEVGGA
jgi:predicted  nucleic acid-binding Zn-ribbon protein|tara:strand:- start:734 stop:898 length:165 start_codon:yes stop_codon:yes gene_type:complete